MDRQGKGDLIPVEVLPVQRCGQRRTLVLVDIARCRYPGACDFRGLTLSPIEWLRVELLFRGLAGKRVCRMRDRHLVLAVRGARGGAGGSLINGILRVVCDAKVCGKRKYDQHGDDQAGA